MWLCGFIVVPTFQAAPMHAAGVSAGSRHWRACTVAVTLYGGTWKQRGLAGGRAAAGAGDQRCWWALLPAVSAYGRHAPVGACCV